MTKPTKESRNEAFEIANDVQVCVYSESGPEIVALCEKHGLTDGLVKKNFTLLVGDVILGFYKDTELLELLQTEVGVDKTKALTITADLLDFLAPLKEAEDKASESTAIDPVSQVAEPEVETPDSPLFHSTNEVAEPEAPSPATATEPEVSPQVEPGESVYSSTQSALINEGLESKGDDKPRWDSQS